MTPEPKPEVLDYIRANRGTYTREAIERELREAGHSTEAIEAAWRAFPPDEAPAPAPGVRAIATAQFWVLLILVACFALTILPFIALFALSAVSSLAASAGGVDGFFGSGLGAILAALAPILLGYLAIGLGGWWLLRRDRPAALGVFGGLVVAFVFSVIVAGTCAAIIAQL